MKIATSFLFALGYAQILITFIDGSLIIRSTSSLISMIKTKVILVLLISVFCTTTVKSQVKRPNGQFVQVNEFSQDSIHFLILKVSNINGKENVELIKSMVRPGRLKKDIDITLHHETEAEPYVLSLMDNKKGVLKSAEFPNPLFEFVEYVDNDGSLRKKEVKFEEKEFLIRIPYDKKNSLIKLEKSPNIIERDQKKIEGNKLLGVIKID